MKAGGVVCWDHARGADGWVCTAIDDRWLGRRRRYGAQRRSLRGGSRNGVSRKNGVTGPAEAVVRTFFHLRKSVWEGRDGMGWDGMEIIQ